MRFLRVYLGSLWDCEMVVEFKAFCSVYLLRHGKVQNDWVASVFGIELELVFVFLLLGFDFRLKRREK